MFFIDTFFYACALICLEKGKQVDNHLLAFYAARDYSLHTMKTALTDHSSILLVHENKSGTFVAILPKHPTLVSFLADSSSLGSGARLRAVILLANLSYLSLWCCLKAGSTILTPFLFHLTIPLILFIVSVRG